MPCRRCRRPRRRQGVAPFPRTTATHNDESARPALRRRSPQGRACRLVRFCVRRRSVEIGRLLAGDAGADIAGKALEVSAEIEPAGTEGVIVTQGGAARGYAVYLTGGKLAFAIRENGELTVIVAKDPLGNGRFLVQATLSQDGALALLVDGKKVAEGKAAGLIQQQPKAGLSVGSTTRAAVGNYVPPNPFKGRVSNVRVKTTLVR